MQSFRIQLLKKKMLTFDRLKEDGIRAMKFERARTHFLGDVFAAVAIVDFLWA